MEATIRIPATANVVSTLASRTTATTQRPRVLLVEDEALIALDLTQQLDFAGFEVIGPASSVAQARQLLWDDDCDAAILDVNLGRGETSEPIAHDLIGRGVPVIVVSGYARSQHPVVFRGLPMVVKPVSIGTLVAELKAVLRLP